MNQLKENSLHTCLQSIGKHKSLTTRRGRAYRYLIENLYVYTRGSLVNMSMRKQNFLSISSFPLSNVSFLKRLFNGATNLLLVNCTFGRGSKENKILLKLKINFMLSSFSQFEVTFHENRVKYMLMEMNLAIYIYNDAYYDVFNCR